MAQEKYQYVTQNASLSTVQTNMNTFLAGENSTDSGGFVYNPQLYVVISSSIQHTVLAAGTDSYIGQILVQRFTR